MASNSDSESSQPLAPVMARQEWRSDNVKCFKVSLDDPTSKVLPLALRKYIIKDDWKNYALFICYSSGGDRDERCLSYDEKPLMLFQKLKDAQKDPVFLLKHIKDICSPIAIAQQKQAARQASSVEGHSSSSVNGKLSAGSGSGHDHTRSASRPPKLEVNDLPQPSTTASLQHKWSEILSPMVGQKEPDLGSPGGISGSGSSEKFKHGGYYAETSEAESCKAPVVREISAPTSEVSYAVAIYPYMAEQDDEFDVVVGDTFVIHFRRRGWLVVQRDPTASGILETDINKQSWVPAGCLLETNVPIAAATAEYNKANVSNWSSPTLPSACPPILPLSIITTSFPGIALMDYQKRGEGELDLVKDDTLRVYKQYNNWFYAVKEEDGDRGWVPSWFVSKV